MPYGSNFKPPKLSSKQIAHPIVPSSGGGRSGLISFFRILLTTAEIGAAFIPGVGVAAEVGIGVAAGTANQLLDIKSGNVSVLGTALNFGTPFVGGAAAGLKNLKQANKLGAKFIEREKVVSGGEKDVLNINKKTLEGLNRYQKFNNQLSRYVRKKFKTVIEPIKGGLKTKIVKKATHMVSSYSTSAAFKVSDNIVRQSREESSYWRKLGIAEEDIQSLLKLLRSSTKENELNNLIEVEKLLKKISLTNKNVEFIKFYNNFTSGISLVRGVSQDIPEATIIYNAFQDAYKGTSLANDLDNQILPWYKKLWRYSGSREFNDKYVQRLQLIDPNDLGRAPIEHLYQVLKRKINKSLKSIYKKGRKIDEAFEKSGGTRSDSAWIMGYKVVIDEPQKKLILITFRPEATYNKRPVLVWADRHQLRQFKEDAGVTYLKYWAISKGGRRVGLTGLFGGISFIPNKAGGSLALNSVLSFIPAQQLRNWLSIVSNYVENISDMVSGNYIGKYFTKLKKSFINTSISRTFRLGGRVVLGGSIGRQFGQKIGNIIGQESQRVGTQIFATGIKNTIAGKSFTKGLSKSSINAALTSARSHSLRGLRSRRGSNSVIVNMISAQRKIGYVKRIPNAVTPGRSALNFQKLKRR